MKTKQSLQSKIAFVMERYLMLARENEFLRKRLENAEKDARTDCLTGLGNKRYATEEVSRLQSLADRTQHKAWLMLVASVDMDGLKPINDQFGHQVGSKALQALAKGLRSVTRTNDIIARVGGDEFIIVGLFKNKKEINVFKKRVGIALSGLSIEETTISTSIGYCHSKLNPKFNFEKSLSLSDKRMYKIKQQKKAGA